MSVTSILSTSSLYQPLDQAVCDLKLADLSEEMTKELLLSCHSEPFVALCMLDYLGSSGTLCQGQFSTVFRSEHLEEVHEKLAKQLTIDGIDLNSFKFTFLIKRAGNPDNIQFMQLSVKEKGMEWDRYDFVPSGVAERLPCWMWNDFVNSVV